MGQDEVQVMVPLAQAEGCVVGGDQVNGVVG